MEVTQLILKKCLSISDLDLVIVNIFRFFVCMIWHTHLNKKTKASMAGSEYIDRLCPNTKSLQKDKGQLLHVSSPVTSVKTCVVSVGYAGA